MLNTYLPYDVVFGACVVIDGAVDAASVQLRPPLLLVDATDVDAEASSRFVLGPAWHFPHHGVVYVSAADDVHV